MTLLLNLIPAIIALVGVIITVYFIIKRNNLKAAIITALISLCSVVLYGQIQPSYIPKTGVKELPLLTLDGDDTEKVIKDNLLPPNKTTSERDKYFEDEVLTYDEKIDKILNEKN